MLFNLKRKNVKLRMKCTLYRCIKFVLGHGKGRGTGRCTDNKVNGTESKRTNY